MRRYRVPLPVPFLPAGALAIGVLAALVGSAFAEEQTATPTVAEIRQADLEKRLRTLASEDMAGREATTPDAWRAADYIAEEMRRAGVAPMGDDGTWFQNFAIPRPRLGENNRLSVALDGEDNVAHEIEKDWNPLTAANGEVSAAVVFAGYGITAPKRGYDDYAGLDVEGRIVLVLRKDPGWNDTNHAAFRAKMANAIRHKAAGILVCNNPATVGEGRDSLIHWRTPMGLGGRQKRIPFAFVSQALARTLLGPLGKSLEELEAALRTTGPASSPLDGVSVTLACEILLNDPTPNARNVVGYLEGLDPAVSDEVVILGAHYDHVGRGHFGSVGGAAVAGTVHPGADDNGSGTVAMIELAEYFAKQENRPRRSLLFVAFTGEEKGLLGSNHHANNPVIPLENTLAMINMDMVGRSREGRLSVGGVGTGTGLEEMVIAANAEIGLDLRLSKQGTAPSDSLPFFRKRLPVLFIFTGIHEDYHRPTDTVDRINFPDMTRIVQLVAGATQRIADGAERMTYTQPPAVKRPPLLGVNLGRRSDARGVALAGVMPNGPAAKAGLEAGDVVVAIAGQEVRNANDLRSVMRNLEAKKEVEVVVLRGEERHVFRVTPAARGRGR